MAEFYWLWYALAFVFEVILISISFWYLLSIRAKNLEKVWLYYSIAQSKFIESKKPSWISHFWWVVIRLIVNPFFSWYIVILRIIAIIKYFTQKLSTPETIKEIDFKIWSVPLDKIEVKKLMQEQANFLWKKIEFEDEYDDILIINDTEDGWYAEIEIYTDKQRYRYYAHTPDYDSEWDNIFEYKIDHNILSQRIVEKRTVHPWEEHYYIKDWVILESKIHEWLKNNILRSPDEEIQDLKKQIEWQTIKNPLIKYFILSRHPEILSPQEFRKGLRQDLEKIKNLILKFQDLCDKYNVWCNYNENNYLELDFKMVQPDDEDNFIREMRLLEQENNCENDEIFESKINIQIIEWYLNEKSS